MIVVAPFARSSFLLAWRHTGLLLPVILLACAMFSGCQKPPVEAAVPPVEVTVAQPQAREVTEFLEFTGKVFALESVELRPQVSGYLVKVEFDEGEEVAKGKLLFEIDPRPFEAELERANAELARSQAALDKASADLARNEKLLGTGAVSREDYDTSVAAKSVAEAAVHSARALIQQAELNLDYTRITSPIDGRVGQRHVSIGNLAAAGTSLLTTVVQIEPIYVQFDIDERSLLRYQKMARESGEDKKNVQLKDLKIPIYIGLDTETGFPHEGVIDFADNQVDPSTGTIRVRGKFVNADGALIPGLNARVKVPLGKPHPALLISDRAIGTDQGLKFVLTVNSESVVETRPVVLGQMFEGLRVVEKGLQADDRVIVNGLMRARPGVKVVARKDSGQGLATEGAAAPAADEQPNPPAGGASSSSKES